MLIKESYVEIGDNSNLSGGRCVHVFGGSGKKYATVGDFVLVSVKNTLKKKALRTKLYLAVLASVRRNHFRKSGNFIKFDENKILLFADKENLLGSKIIAPVSSELRALKLLRVPLLSRCLV